jgi:hypothetical protein
MTFLANLKNLKNLRTTKGLSIEHVFRVFRLHPKDDFCEWPHCSFDMIDVHKTFTSLSFSYPCLASIVISRCHFSFRNGDNFVYPTSDWVHFPLRSSLYLIVLAIASILLHLAFNVVHEIRRKVGENFVGKEMNFGDEEEVTQIAVA